MTKRVGTPLKPAPRPKADYVYTDDVGLVHLPYIEVDDGQREPIGFLRFPDKKPKRRKGRK